MPHAAASTARPVHRYRTLLRSRFLRHNAIFLFGAVAVGALNYVYYSIMGRILSPASFGEVQVLFSLFAQIAIFLNVLSLLTVTIVANYSDPDRRNRMVLELEKLALLGSFAIVIIAMLAAPLLQSFFHFDHTLPFVLLAAAILAGTPLAFRSGFLRGRKRFGLVTVVSVATSLGNIIFAAGLALGGMGSAGALAGLAIGQLTGFALAAFLARRHGLVGSFSFKKLRAIDFKLVAPELRYALLVLIGSLAITGLYSLDVIVVKHYFDAHTAGLYAGIATVARIIFFATASVLQVMLPSVKLQRSMGSNSRLLGKSLLLLIGIGGLPLLTFTLFPEQVIQLLMGTAYLPYAHLLPWLGLAIFIIAILNLLVMYHIALRRFAAGLIALAGITCTYALVILHHRTVGEVVAGLCIGSCLSLVVLGAWTGGRYITRMRGGSNV
jgi:O-antigen/teichoic acid export membrane protein